MADFKNYDPGRHILSYRGYNITGFAEGTFIKVERAVDAFSTVVGSVGDVVRVRSRNRSGSVTITLQGASPVNAYLSVIALADEVGLTVDAGVGPLSIIDLNGATIVRAENAWIRKIAAFEAAMEHTNREWALDCSELYMYVGGAFR